MNDPIDQHLTNCNLFCIHVKGSQAINQKLSDDNVLYSYERFLSNQRLSDEQAGLYLKY